MKFGIDRLLSDPALQAELKGRRVALLAHPASVTADLTHSIDALAALPDIRLTAAFGPQHGMKGDLQELFKKADRNGTPESAARTRAPESAARTRAPESAARMRAIVVARFGSSDCPLSHAFRPLLA